MMGMMAMMFLINCKYIRFEFNSILVLLWEFIFIFSLLVVFGFWFFDLLVRTAKAWAIKYYNKTNNTET